MIKNKLKKALITLSFLGTSLVANSSAYMYDGYSLLSIEGGYSGLSADLTYPDYSQPAKLLDGEAYHIGMKIGAQTGHYRIFLSARMYQDVDDDFDYLATYGIEGQYLFYMFDWADFYIGAGAGILNAKYLVTDEPTFRTINDPYFNVETGFNIHTTDFIDLELGVRYVSIDALNSQIDAPDYRLNDMISGYASIVFKYKMD